ncbi:hypothetical protein DM01DRAFT_1336648 [Hesseltinella vesiculosa]|uniref:Uncharacterized protein n=1 Tax=Hesseltinella vesiculosa TaxID=101127 RepID=A0A1X2GFY6_9FUNG|nr:hypothetical protein DM01DRAFT_1336648 [Hesseltinella vesiculosa]
MNSKDESKPSDLSPEPTAASSPTSSNPTSNDSPDSPNSTATSNNGEPNNPSHARVTRSLSVDSSNDDSASQKRRRITNSSSTPTSTAKSTRKKPSSSSTSTTANMSSIPIHPSNTDEFERETRNSSQRLSKEAKDAKKAEREVMIKKKLAELDQLEKTVKDHSHEEYHKLLEDIQAKRSKKLTVAQGRHSLMESNFRNGFLAQKKSAFDKFHLDKLALRRAMIYKVQQKINRIEQEYYASQQTTKSSLDDQNLADWMPPDRPSMINILFYFIEHNRIFITSYP